ncbi:ABC transporter six-transmembrane domain-containing protein [Symbiopectobacterium purcellii]|uniref:ABC transporter six-transmembrane domain-containing protein n=1 Tax=Symbiopectobacterium purcellii TaxID=2871826 RepID=A0ABX9AQH1_9ENTR|nr:ABC transporter six-transmembrane domain-containing protein [Symbiopectobacterium purcellii]QZN97412.1 ABC transporter six-transmembrane domain-containing protein [Symbiopectobacterium purcellii]
MQNTSYHATAVRSHSAVGTLKNLAVRHKKKLFFTLLLVVAENVIYLLYPLLAGFAINAIMKGQAAHGVFYAALVLLMWGIGAARRSIDTRTFARIYAALAVPVILTQREDAQNNSTIAARLALSREFVSFFETHLPLLITSLASICGAVVMLLVIERMAGFFCLGILAFFALFLSEYTRRNEVLYQRLNNRLEKDIAVVSSAGEKKLHRHYDVMARLRIRLSDREACGYLAIGAASALLFGGAIMLMAGKKGIDAGHVYSVMTYLWMFVMSLDDSPALLEKYAQLKEIGKRVNTGLG